MLESLVVTLLSQQRSLACAVVPAQPQLPEVCIWSSFSFYLNVTFSENLCWLPIRLVLYCYCNHPQPFQSVCTSPVLLRSLKTGILLLGCLSNQLVWRLVGFKYLLDEWKYFSVLVLCFCLIFASVFQEISVLCPQLGGLALLLCVGVETFSKMGRYWFTCMKILAVGWASGMAGFLCSMIVPRYSSPHFQACNLASFSGRYSGEGSDSQLLFCSFLRSPSNMGRGFWVAWLGSQALPWTVCWAQGGEILWAWGPIGKWKESQDDKAAHYHCPLHHTLKISCGPQHVRLLRTLLCGYCWHFSCRTLEK